jgi:GNAT superfamily N-acetyltransferase
MAHEQIRRARREDAPALVDLSERKRIEYQAYQPRFWRKAADSREKQLPFFERLIESDRVIALVYEEAGRVNGFVIASLVDAPPVYDPGGQTCLIDDFVVYEPSDWAMIGTVLLIAAIQEARERGAVQTVVVCGHGDGPKRSMLAKVGFSIASEWYVREID